MGKLNFIKIIDWIIAILGLLWNRKKIKQANERADSYKSESATHQAEVDILNAQNNVPSVSPSKDQNDAFNDKEWNKI